MKMKNYVILLMIFIVLSGCATANNDKKYGFDKFVGVWQLSRYDNIPEIDQPPGDIINITYFFYRDGRYRFFQPGEEKKYVYGRGNTPFSKYIPLSIYGNKIKTWFGLTNDLDGEKFFKFMGDNELRIFFADGSIATLYKKYDDPDNYKDEPPICAPHTIHGVNYYEEYINKLLDDIRETTEPSKNSQAIVGEWVHGNIEKDNKENHMIFGEDGSFKRNVMRKDKYSSEIKTITTNGKYKLIGNIIELQIWGCFGPDYFKIIDNNLIFYSNIDEVFLEKI